MTMKEIIDNLVERLIIKNEINNPKILESCTTEFILLPNEQTTKFSH